MVFSSITFIFYFLPLVLILYYLLPKKYRNIILFLMSLIFYYVGERKLLIVFIISILFHYLWGLLLDKNHQKSYLIIGILFDVLLLAYFKYSNFFISNINHVLGSDIVLLNVSLPIGISFFTFQGISYLVDIYRGSIEVQRSFINFGTYISFFPQLIAGPIVRYKDIEKDLIDRKENDEDFVLGIKRFVIGFGKKIIIADSFAVLIKNLGVMANKTILSTILEALAYTFQLYFDFSAYSDMAIGLGLFFGFHFLENFNYPLFSTSITDFWRRWHISLSSWFKDYIYIPLGGSRVNKYRHIFNILIVWLLTGFWHGANWNFILWGLYFGIILIIEKYYFLKYLNKHKIISSLYTFIVVVIGFVIFNHSDIKELFTFLGNMFGFNGLAFSNAMTLHYLKGSIVLYILAFIFASPLVKRLSLKLKEKNYKIFYVIDLLSLSLLLILSLSYLLSASFSPFLYFRF